MIISKIWQQYDEEFRKDAVKLSNANRKQSRLSQTTLGLSPT